MFYWVLENFIFCGGWLINKFDFYVGEGYCIKEEFLELGLESSFNFSFIKDLKFRVKILVFVKVD